MPQVTLNGKLEAFWETGTEGVLWSFVEGGREGYENLHVLKNGDKLTVFADAARLATKWKGTIELEYERNWQAFPQNPQYGQQAVSGYWVHGLEKTLPPEEWAQMFFDAASAQLIFSAQRKVSRFAGHLAEFIVPDMQAPSWRLESRRRRTNLQNGDHLTVFEDTTKRHVLWKGALEFDDIDIRTKQIFPPPGQLTTPEDIQAHIFPKNIPANLWTEWINDKRPAKLVRRYWQRTPSEPI